MTLSQLVLGPRFTDNQTYTFDIALFDVDNTLVGNEVVDLPTERFKQAVQAAQKVGKQVGLASARPLSKVAHILDFIGADGMSILCNGGQIINNHDRSVIAEWFIGPQSCAAILKELDRLTINYWINDNGVDHFPVAQSPGKFEKQTDIWDLDSPRIEVPDYSPQKPFVIVLRRISESEAKAMTDFVDGLGDDTIKTLIAHEIIQDDGSKLLDQFVVHKQANKLHALHEVSRLQSMPLERILAVGDGRNDAVLVNAAGIGVAMGNSAQETLDVATFIAPNREDDGAAIALEELTVFGRPRA